ncbi:putative Tautomerase/MIF superfamily [Seiridium unicorne]|uniref:L-dopachrome isomerase n=1 Tax=Seiridium unicorne TaxID=138068 RepID=A0ABR2URL7_9PEZI
MEPSATPSPGVKSHLPHKSPAHPQSRQNVAPSASLSFAQRKAQLPHPSKSIIVEGNDVMRNIERPPPGDMISRRKSQQQSGLAKKRSAYYENEFAASRETDPTKDRVRNEAIVLAELRTNVIIQDEFTFITDLSYHLSNRYQRSMSSIVINLQHGCCMMFGGSFDPAYTLTIFALPSLVQPTTNKRNAALMQNQIQESIGVAPSRGYVRFVATPEEDVANAGKTVAGEIDEQEKTPKDESKLETPKPSKSKRLSVRSFASLRSSTPGNAGPDILPTPPASADETPMIATAIPEHPPTPPAESPRGEEKPAKTAGRRKSFVMALFGGKASSKEKHPKTPSGQTT